jgi:hypothetical protein
MDIQKEVDALNDELQAFQTGKRRFTRAQVDEITKRVDALEADVKSREKGDVQKLEQRASSGTSPPSTFEKGVEMLRSGDSALSRTRAMRRARQLWPELLEKYQTDGRTAQAAEEDRARADMAKRNAPEVQQFEGLCDEIQAGDRCSRLEAVKRAARTMNATRTNV